MSSVDDPNQAPPEDGPDPFDPRSRVGTLLAGRYELVEYLGGGAQGEVYAALHRRIGRRDAIKILKRRFRHDSDAVARFTRGAANASRISHPNVCTVYDFGETEEGLPFLASEFVSGVTLGQVLEEEGTLDARRAVDLVEQVASALDAAHDLGIVHRDLKPDNIMITTDASGRERVKVVDFDIAKGSKEGLEGGITRGGWVVGTPQYMSPEQLSEDSLDGRSDVYSLAVVLFKALTGRLPTRSSTTQDMMVERLTQDALPLSEAAPEGSFPPALEEVLAAALSRGREERPRRATDFARQLAAALAPAGAPGPLPRTEMQRPPSEPSTPAPEESEPPGPPRWLVPLGAAMAVVVLGASGWALLTSGGEPSSVSVPESLALSVGEVVSLEATVTDVDGEPVPGVRPTFDSDEPGVAAVAEDGLVRGVGPGVAVVRATLGDATASTRVEVADGLRADPGAIEFVGTEGTSPEPLEVDVRSMSGSSGAVTVDTELDGDWLRAELTDSIVPTTLRLTPSVAGLAPGIHSGRVLLRLAGARGTLELPVRMSLADRGQEGGTGGTGGSATDRAEGAERARRMLVLVSRARTAGELRAVADSTAPLWEDGSLPAETRALAAYVHGLALDRLGEGGAEACRLWAGRALELAPGDESYRRQLEACGT